MIREREAVFFEPRPPKRAERFTGHFPISNLFRHAPEFRCLFVTLIDGEAYFPPQFVQNSEGWNLMQAWLTPHFLKSGASHDPVALPIPPVIEEGRSAQRTERVEFVVGSAPTCDIVIQEEGWEPQHLRFVWRRSKATWEVMNVSERLLVIENRALEKGEHIPLLGWEMSLTSEEVTLRFERVPGPPEVNGKVVEEIPLTDKGIIIGRGAVTKEGNTAAPRLCLDSQMYSIASTQAEVVKRGGDYVLINRNNKLPAHRTSINGSQAFDEVTLVLGDCIQIPNCPQYTFRYTGSSLRHAGAGGVLAGKDLGVTVSGGRKILRSVSIDILQGRFLGIIGGSGQGKSTLLNALCGIAPPTEGLVTVDGSPVRSERDVSRAGIAYVPQDDIVHRELTVQQALWYAARLRLRATKRQIAQVIDGVLETLELTEHREKPINKLSGGQRKRVSIASELLASPEYLFLDEPTSGLDPQTENMLMGALQKLAIRRRMGIVCTTHVLQTANLFHRLGYIARGRLIFHGAPADASRFFLSSGKPSATALLHGSVGASGSVHASGPASASATASGSRVARFDSSSADDYLLEKITLIYERAQNLKNTADVQDAEAEKWEEQYKKSRFFIPPATLRKESAAASKAKRPRKVGAILSFLLLFSRQWKLLVSARLNYVFLLMQALVIGGLIGWVTEGVELRMFLALISVLWFGCSNAAQKIVDELPIFLRERISGLGANVYVLSKLVFISTITLCQASLLMAVMIGTALVFHPPDAKLSDLDKRGSVREEMRRYLKPGSDDELSWIGRIQVWRKAFEIEPAVEGQMDDDFSFLSAPADAKPQSRDAFEPIDEKTFKQNKGTAGLGAALEKPVEPEGLHGVPKQWRGALSWVALLFDLRTNIVREMSEELERDHSRPEERPSVPKVLLHCLGLRLAAILLAAIVGVAMGLAVSALVNTATQAMMWVPLLMIPQILLGGMVVKLPDMSPMVRAFSSIMPSFATERINMVSLIFGQVTPQTTNQTKVPGFIRYEYDVVKFVDEASGKDEEERYDRLSPFNDSWQSLAVAFDRVGQRKKETSGKDMITDQPRKDLRYRYQMDGAVFIEMDLAAKAAGSMGLWLGISYLLCVFSLKRKKAR